jgi:hypothetical protein
LINAFAGGFELSGDGISGGSPHERLRVASVVFNIIDDGGFQLFDTEEC